MSVQEAQVRICSKTLSASQDIWTCIVGSSLLPGLIHIWTYKCVCAYVHIHCMRGLAKFLLFMLWKVWKSFLVKLESNFHFWFVYFSFKKKIIICIQNRILTIHRFKGWKDLFSAIELPSSMHPYYGSSCKPISVYSHLSVFKFLRKQSHFWNLPLFLLVYMYHNDFTAALNF